MDRREAASDLGRVAVAIIGGGVAGCATALSLVDHGVRGVALFDSGVPASFRIGETIPGAASRLLRQLGVWPAFQAQGHLPSTGSTSLWGKARPGHNDAVFDPHGGGWHLDRVAFEGMLRDAARGIGVPCHDRWRLRSLARQPAGGFLIGFDADGRACTMAADMLVDASGIAAAAARRMPVARNVAADLTVRYGVFALADGAALPCRTFLEAQAYGWWYAARIPGYRLVVALASDADSLRDRGLDSAAAWHAALRRTDLVAPLLVEARVGPQTPPVLTCPAPTAILSRVAGADWLAVGDAAASSDPLTSQGLIRALSQGLAAGAAIHASAQGGGEAPLMAYQAEVFRSFTGNLRLLAGLYAAEARWPDAPFWRRRHLHPAPAERALLSPVTP